MTKWEYKIMQMTKSSLPVAALNKMGKEEWELCGIIWEGYIIFKRPIEE